MEFPSSNNKERLPYEHYIALYRELDTAAASERTGFPFENGAFIVTMMNRRYRASFPDFEITPLDADKVGGDMLVRSTAARILIMRYIIEGRLTPMNGEYLAYRDVPWGAIYAQNFNGRCILRLGRGFGYKPESFEKGMESLGALRINGGDAAFVLELLPSLMVKYIMWYGDDEFPPSAQILFGDNFPAAFTAEDMAVVGDVSLDALKRATTQIC